MRRRFIPAQAGESQQVAAPLPRRRRQRRHSCQRLLLAQIQNVGHRIVLRGEIAYGRRRGRRRHCRCHHRRRRRSRSRAEDVVVVLFLSSLMNVVILAVAALFGSDRTAKIDI